LKINYLVFKGSTYLLVKNNYNEYHGLKNIKERARLLKGKFNLNSIKGKGTEIKIKIPYEVIRGVKS